MQQIIYWQAPVWAIVSITAISLVYIGWLTVRSARQARISNVLPKVNPLLGEIALFFFTHSEGLQCLNETATARLEVLQTTPVFMDSLLEAHIEGRIIQERLTDLANEVLLVIPLTISNNVEGVLATVTSSADSAKTEAPAEIAATGIPDITVSDNWIVLGQTLRLHTEQPRGQVARTNPADYGAQPQWQDFKLNMQEQLIIRKLVETVGTVQTGETLFKCAWPEDSIEPYGLSPSQRERLRRLIYQLRQHIEPDPQAPKYLLTAHGVGYTFYREETVICDA